MLRGGTERRSEKGKMKIHDMPMSKLFKVRYESEKEREKILKALEVLDTPVKVLKYTG